MVIIATNTQENVSVKKIGKESIVNYLVMNHIFRLRFNPFSTEIIGTISLT